jgi:hypothetical protein
MRRIVFISATLLASAASVHDVAAAGSAHTQFRWTDGAGTPHYSDTLTADALKYGYDVLNGKGVLVKHVERQSTPEELLAAETAAQIAADAKRDADLQEMNDKRMLAAFPSERDLLASRQAQLDNIDHNIRAATNSLGVQERGLSEALATAAAFDHEGKPIPDAEKKQIESLRKTVDTLRAYVARREKEKVDAAKKLEVDLAHYREAREKLRTPQP